MFVELDTKNYQNENENKDGWDSNISNWQKNNKTTDLKKDNNDNPKSLDLRIEKNFFKAIIVLAGGIDQQGLCHKFVQDRLDLAYQLFLDNPQIIICSGGGSYHTKTITNQSGFVIHESTSCSQYLMNKGVPGKYIYKEWSSYDTIANGYFSFTNFIIPLRLTEVTIITSNFHMERSKLIFSWMNDIFNYNLKLIFLESNNDAIESEVLEARKAREKNSCQNISNILIKEYNTLPKFHCWFYSEHKAYCCISQDIKLETLDDKCSKSY